MCYWGTSAQKPRTCPMWIPESSLSPLAHPDPPLWVLHPLGEQRVAPRQPSRLHFERQLEPRHIQFLTGDRRDASVLGGARRRRHRHRADAHPSRGGSLILSLSLSPPLSVDFTLSTRPEGSRLPRRPGLVSRPRLHEEAVVREIGALYTRSRIPRGRACRARLASSRKHHRSSQSKRFSDACARASRTIRPVWRTRVRGNSVPPGRPT